MFSFSEAVFLDPDAVLTLEAFAGGVWPSVVKARQLSFCVLYYLELTQLIKFHCLKLLQASDYF